MEEGSNKALIRVGSNEAYLSIVMGLRVEWIVQVNRVCLQWGVGVQVSKWTCEVDCANEHGLG
jgi:hypothetical protein